MPGKRGGVITTGEARLLMKDPSTMKTALLCLQIEAGDRLDDARLRNPNQSDSARGFRRLSDREWDAIRDIVKTLVDAAAARRASRRRVGLRGSVRSPGVLALIERDLHLPPRRP